MSETTIKNKDQEPLIRQLFRLGAHFSFSRSRRHPSAEGFIFGYKNRHAVIDLEQTLAGMEKAKTFIRNLALAGGTVLLVGTKNEARNIVIDAAERLNLPCVALRWVGGTLTNFKNIRRRIERLAEIDLAAKTGELEKYTKKERARIEKERADLARLFGRLAGLEKPPQALIVIDAGEEEIAVTEAVKTGVPIVSLSGSDCDFQPIAYPVVGNDTSAATIKWFVDELVAAFAAGQAAAKVKLATAEMDAEKTPS